MSPFDSVVGEGMSPYFIVYTVMQMEILPKKCRWCEE